VIDLSGEIQPLQALARVYAQFSKLKGHMADARYYLLRGEVYHLAWHMARKGHVSSLIFPVAALTLLRQKEEPGPGATA
jgi:hypothetical protein